MKAFLPLIIIAISIGMYFAYIKPATGEVKSLLAKKMEFNNVLNKTKELTIIRKKVLEEYHSIPADDIERLSKIIPETFNAVSFVNDLNVRASQYGMTIKDFNETAPKSEVRDAIVINKGQKDVYKTTIVRFKVIGSYNLLKKFLNDLETSLRLIDVTELTVKPANLRIAGDVSLEYSLEITTYSLR